MRSRLESSSPSTSTYPAESVSLWPLYALLAMVNATTSIITGEFEPMLWVRLLVGYDVAFTTVALLLFAPVLHAE